MNIICKEILHLGSKWYGLGHWKKIINVHWKGMLWSHIVTSTGSATQNMSEQPQRLTIFFSYHFLLLPETQILIFSYFLQI